MPGALRAAPNPARGMDFSVQETGTALRSDSNLSVVVIGNYSGWSDDGGTMPSKRVPFTPSSILVRPHQMLPQSLGLQRHVVEAPGTAPGSEWLITESIYRYSRTNPAHPIYVGTWQKKRVSQELTASVLIKQSPASQNETGV